jgi:hypothetical protein
MAKSPQLPKGRLMKVALEARMKPDLRRLALLHQAAARFDAYPDWQASFSQVRMLNKKDHRSLLVASNEVRYVQDSGDELGEPGWENLVPETILRSLEVSVLQRMGHRRWYVLPLEMSFQEAVDLFHLRYYTIEDPARALGHQIRDVLYRVDTSDKDGWAWHITFAPTPRAQTLEQLNYDFDVHWPLEEARIAMTEVQERMPEVGLYVDLDCYRDTTDIVVEDWDTFVRQSSEKMESVSKSLFASFEESASR